MVVDWESHRAVLLTAKAAGATAADLAKMVVWREAEEGRTVEVTPAAMRARVGRWLGVKVEKRCGAHARGAGLAPATAPTPVPAPFPKAVDTPPLPRELIPPEPAPDHEVALEGIPAKVATIADPHIPIHNARDMDGVIARLRVYRPDVLMLPGDFLDCWLISSHDHNPERLFAPGARLQEEIDAAIPILRELASCAGRVEWLIGNHEHRLSRLVSSHPGLFGLAALEWERLLNLPSNVHVHRYGAQYRIGPVTWIHGDRAISDRAVHVAHLMLLKYLGRNMVFGHFHRSQMMHKSAPDEYGRPHAYSALSVGHLTRPEEHREYITDPNWQSGYAEHDFWMEGGKVRFNHRPITITDGKFSVDGRLYGGALCQ